jgi:cyclase
MEASRRHRLPFAPAAAVILCAASLRAVGEVPPSPQSFTLVPAGPGIYAAVAKEGNRDSVGNAGFVIGSSGVLVVDTFASPAAAEELAGEIRRLTAAPVRWVVNTHYHLDHIGGNAVFARRGASLVAHEKVRAWARTENLKWRKEITPKEKAMLAALVLPDLTHTSGISIWLGDRQVEVLERPGHTGGDSVVLVRDANVLFTGDLFWKGTVPNLVDASTGAWVDTLDGFLREFPATMFVPGHGDVGKALDVRFFRDYLSGLRLSVAKGIEDGQSGQALVAVLLPRHRERFGSWKWFGQFAEKNIASAEEELKGTKRYPPTRPPEPSPAPPGGRPTPVPTAFP